MSHRLAGKSGGRNLEQVCEAHKRRNVDLDELACDQTFHATSVFAGRSRDFGSFYPASFTMRFKTSGKLVTSSTKAFLETALRSRPVRACLLGIKPRRLESQSKASGLLSSSIWPLPNLPWEDHSTLHIPLPSRRRYRLILIHKDRVAEGSLCLGKCGQRLAPYLREAPTALRSESYPSLAHTWLRRYPRPS